jgi:malate synthase
LGDRANQVDRQRDDVEVAAEDLLDVASAGGAITLAGLRDNVEVSLVYLDAWIQGAGAVAIHNLMEDAATVEISRSQIWQWVHNESLLDDGTQVTAELVRRVLDEEMVKLLAAADGIEHRLEQARTIFEEVALADDYVDFLTLPAYAQVVGS